MRSRGGRASAACAPTSRARAPRRARRAPSTVACVDGRVERGLAELGLDLAPRRPRAARRGCPRAARRACRSRRLDRRSRRRASGSSLRLTSLTVTANSASWPASSSAPVVVGERQLRPCAPRRPWRPTSSSSKPGIRLPEPSSTSWSRPSPPANGSPSSPSAERSRSPRSRPRRPVARPSPGAPGARAAARSRASIGLVVDRRLAPGDLEALVLAQLRRRAHADLDRELSASRPRRAGRRGRAAGSPTGTMPASSIASRTSGRASRAPPRRAPPRGRRAGSPAAAAPCPCGSRAASARVRAGAPCARTRRSISSAGTCASHAHARLGQLGDGRLDGG